MKLSTYRVTDGESFSMRKQSTDDAGKCKNDGEIDIAMTNHITELIELQNKLYADNHYGVLLVLQAMDAAGKDGVIKHVMSGLNPQGVQVKAFKAPSLEELDHDYLWRCNPYLPARGNIAIFNRSYYEDVIVVKVHQLLAEQNMPDKLIRANVWKNRYRQLQDYERYLTENGIVVVKVFLHISLQEQQKRLLERIDNPSKNWKFSGTDVHERQYWKQYMDAYEEMIRETSSEEAPWYIVPADHKRFARLLISEILVKTLKKLPLKYPVLDEEAKKTLLSFRAILSGAIEGGSQQ
jgi:PPK2 family polyphosphate:nucleotide phosphotransferase